MSVEKVARAGGEVVWRVRWRQHGRNRARTFSTKRDARDFDAEVRHQRRTSGLGGLDAGTESLGEYVTGAWAVSHAVTLAPKTRLHYASLYDHHVRPYLGSIPLRDITPEVIGRWQADRLAAGAGPVAVRQAMDLLGSILLLVQRAISLGEEADTKTRQHRTVRLLASLACDLRSWRITASPAELITPNRSSQPRLWAAESSSPRQLRIRPPRRRPPRNALEYLGMTASAASRALSS
jgi:hypothetical protein